MRSEEKTHEILNRTDKNEINRREFFKQSACCTAGLALLTLPGIMTRALAADGGKSKEEIFSELEAKTDKYMTMYMTCSQPTFATLNEQFGLNAEGTIPAIMPFAGGIVGQGETCGAVSGAMLAIGFHFETIMKKTGSSIINGIQFFDRFSKEFGSTRCREVIKHQYGRYFDLSKPEEQRLFEDASLKNPGCLEVIQKAVVMAGDIIMANS